MNVRQKRALENLKVKLVSLNKYAAALIIEKQLLPVLQLVGSLKKQHHAHRSNQQNIFQKI